MSTGRLVLASMFAFLAGGAKPADAESSRSVLAPAAPFLGKPVAPAEANAWNITVFPDGTGLPSGRGDAMQGRGIFARRCAACHGEAGRGATAEELAGRSGALGSASPDKTIGQYWPYSTTVFDFIRRAMPLDAPGSLSANEVYALTAYLLFVNDIIGERDEMNASTLPKVVMPNRNGFVGIDAR